MAEAEEQDLEPRSCFSRTRTNCPNGAGGMTPTECPECKGRLEFIPAHALAHDPLCQREIFKCESCKHEFIWAGESEDTEYED